MAKPYIIHDSPKPAEVDAYTQEEIVRFMLHDVVFLQDFSDDLQPTMFNGAYYTLALIARQHYRTYGKNPSLEVVIHEIPHHAKPEVTDAIIGKAKQLYQSAPTDGQYVKDRIVAYIKNQRLENSLTGAIEELRKSSNQNKPPDHSEIRRILDTAYHPLASESKSVETDAAAIPDMPADAMYGELGEAALQMKTPLGYSYPALLATAIDTPADDHVRSNIYVALLGPVGKGKSESRKRAFKIADIDQSRRFHNAVPGSDRGLYELFPEGGLGKSYVLDTDELAAVMSKIAIQGSTLAATLCTLWDNDEVTPSTKTGVLKISANLSVLGPLKCDNPHDFAKIFGSNTTGGLADRFLFGYTNESWEWHKWSAPPRHWECSQPDFSEKAHQMFAEWAKQSKDIDPTGRLRQNAMRIALKTSSVNGDYTVTDDAVKAALTFVEWQAQIRQHYQPGVARTIDAEVTGALFRAVDAIPEGESRKWSQLAKRHDWYDTYGIDKVKRIRDVAVAEGEIGYDKHTGVIWRKRK